ncbi:MAG TPA: enoyl-CoA hydratase-related protein [Thermoanaerobaculia bacterium]|jgi:enoyl-CoA hydratase|nr:enoyl-CoA hydratase-related protein [Thermoanaerobaculia bacterium]
MSLVEIEVADRVLVATVNRPEKMNALNAEVLAGLDDAIQRARSDAEVGVMIVTGAGPKAFVAGADIAELATMTPVTGREHARRGQAVFSRLESLGKPVIAAINGFALGGGCELALACTLRIASENARLGQPEVKLGILPGYGGSQRLARIVGEGRAMEICLTGEPITAAEAHRIGLVNRVVPAGEALAAARELAAKMLANAPLALAFTMDAIHHGLDLPLEDGLELEATLFGVCASTQDMREGMAAFLEKRPANFAGR